jgi:hypothetical protein
LPRTKELILMRPNGKYGTVKNSDTVRVAASPHVMSSSGINAMQQLALDGRHRDKNGQIAKKYGNTLTRRSGVPTERDFAAASNTSTRSRLAVFHKTHTDLGKWFMAAYLTGHDKRGVSTLVCTVGHVVMNLPRKPIDKLEG